MTVSMSAVWDRTSEFLGDHMAAVAGIATIAIFVPNVITETLAPLKDSGGGAKLGLALLSLAFAILSLWGQLAIAALAIDPTAGPASARARAGRRLGPMILVALALVAVAVALALPVLAVLVANGVDLARLGQPGAQQSLTPGAGGFIALYCLILIPVALWLLARFAILSVAVVAAEDRTLGALGRAYRLTKGLTWRIIGVFVLYCIVMAVAGLAVVTVAGALFSLLPGAGAGQITIATVLGALVTALLTTIFSVIGTAYPAKLYLAARDREGVAPA